MTPLKLVTILKYIQRLLRGFDSSYPMDTETLEGAFPHIIPRIQHEDLAKKSLRRRLNMHCSL